MRIAFYIDEFPSYSETFVVNQIIGLINVGFDVSIVTTRVKYDVSMMAIDQHRLLDKVVVVKNNHGKGYKALWPLLKDVVKSCSSKTFRRYLYRDLVKGSGGAHKLAVLMQNKTHIKVDAIIAHFGPNAVTAMRLRELGVLSGKIYAVFHGYDMSKHRFIKQFLPSYKQLFSTNMMALPVSECWRQKLIKFGCPPEKIVVNRMGVDITQFNFAPKPALSIPLSILTVARHTEKKGIEFAIHAMALLKQKQVSFRYCIAGVGPLFETHQRLIDKLHLNEHVFLLGYKNQNEINQLLETSDVFLLPSVTPSSGDQEGVPVSLMEAMAKGVICISSIHSGIPELITHNESGFLVPEKDATGICEQIQNIMHVDRLTIANNAHNKVATGFSQAIAYKQLADILVGQTVT